MKAPTLRQLSGFVMIVNTLLPAVVVVTLGLMIWSTAVAIKRNTCATVSYVVKAVNDEKASQRYVGASDEAKAKAVAELVKRLIEQAPPDEASCGPWADLRARIAAILTDEIYGKAVERIEYEIKVVDGKLQKVKRDVQSVVPKIPPIKYSGIAGVDQAIWAANQLFQIVRTALGALGAALTELGRGLTDPFETAGQNIYKEIEKVDYKRAVTWGLLNRFLSDTADLFAKFGWLFAILVLWLVLSYALWVYRRLAVGWALLRDRAAVA
jgi:hypothetical protein